MAINNIRTSGGIFSHHFIEFLQQDTLAHPAVRPESFTLSGHDRVTGKELEKSIATAWTSLVERWDMVEREYGSFDISALRQRWLRPLFYHLNIETEYQRGDIVLEGELRFPISHIGRAGTTEFTLPVHSLLYEKDDTLETRVGSGRGIKTLAPHDMVQRYLNLSKVHDWAILTDGVFLRLLRDFHHTYTRGFVEFDLQGIFSSRDFSGFRALYRLLHASRFVVIEDNEQAPVDELYEDSLAMGVKVGDDLRKNVQAAIESLANGLLSSSPGFLDQVRSQEDGAGQLYRDILMTIYRMLFMLFAEQRGMLPGLGSLYMEEYSMTSFRTLAEQPIGEDRNVDLWEKIKTTISMVEHGVEELDIYAYNGALFSLDRTSMLTPKDVTNGPQCRNDHFLVTIRHLTTVEKDKVLQRISYADLSVEEIGSIYESLLEFTPRISETKLEVEGRQINANTFFLDPRGGGRRTTGSYYTPPSLVNELIKSALVPVMENRIRAVVPGYDSEYVEALTPEERQAAEEALLAINVVDPAAGSGAFLIAANNKLGLELARVRSGELFPSEKTIQRARRDVLAHCIYAVDLNPMAVELCKVSLWINAAVEDAPLNFLDHHIKCGNSLVGATPDLIAKGIPNEAYKPVSGDEKETAKAIKAQNREELKGQLSLMKVSVVETKKDLHEWSEIDRLAEIDPSKAEARYMAYWGSQDYWEKRLPNDLWTASFFSPLVSGIPIPTTQDVKQASISPEIVDHDVKKLSLKLVKQYRFHHWHLEFPQVFDENGNGGFDVVLGNPPWERVKLQEKEFFSDKDAEIGQASTAAKRRKLIKKLPEENPALWDEYQKELRASECTSSFLRDSGRFPLTAVGDVNTYQVFSGLATKLINDQGRAGIIVPSGIATEYFNQQFFQSIVDKNQLLCLYDFQNSEGIFPAVDRNQKFSLLTVGNEAEEEISADLVFGVRNIDELLDVSRHLQLSKSDFHLINPNTLTCPIFHSKEAADITKKIYKSVPIFINQVSGTNAWDTAFLSMLHMTNDSNLFRSYEDFEAKGSESVGYIFIENSKIYLPLYEGKMIHQYDHRFAQTLSGGSGAGIRGKSVNITGKEHEDPSFFANSRYYISYEEVARRGGKSANWFLGFRGITGAVANVRTTVFSIAPLAGFGNSMPVLQFHEEVSSLSVCGLFGNFNSFVLDFVTRHKISGVNLNFYIIEQLPILPPTSYSPDLLNYIVPRILELTFTAWDLKPFADDIWNECILNTNEGLQKAIYHQWHENSEATNGGHSNLPTPTWLNHIKSNRIDHEFPHQPFKWEENRQFKVKRQLDALYGHLYNLTRNEFSYILSNFSIVQRRDIDRFGEYRTKSVILKEFDKLAEDPMMAGVCMPLSDRVSVLENSENEQPKPSERPVAVTGNTVVSNPESAGKVEIKTKKLAKKPKTPENQQTMFGGDADFSSSDTDYSLYRCQKCGKPVMGFSLEEHTKEVHGGEEPGYEKIK